MRKIFLTKRSKKCLESVGLEPEISNLLSTALPTTPSRSALANALKIAYIKKTRKKILSYKMFHKIRFVGTTDEIVLANFGDNVTRSFVKNSQKREKIFFWSSAIAEQMRSFFPPHF